VITSLLSLFRASYFCLIIYVPYSNIVASNFIAYSRNL